MRALKEELIAFRIDYPSTVFDTPLCYEEMLCFLKGELRCIFDHTEIMLFSNSIDNPAKAKVVNFAQALVSNFN